MVDNYEYSAINIDQLGKHANLGTVPKLRYHTQVRLSKVHKVRYQYGYYLPPRRRPGRYCNAVRPSVTFGFCTVTQKCMMYFFKILQIRAPCHGGVLYSCFLYWWNVVLFFMNFLNIEKNKILRIVLLLNISCFLFFTFYAISNITKIGVKILCKNSQGGV